MKPLSLYPISNPSISPVSSTSKQYQKYQNTTTSYPSCCYHSPELFLLLFLVPRSVFSIQQPLQRQIRPCYSLDKPSKGLELESSNPSYGLQSPTCPGSCFLAYIPLFSLSSASLQTVWPSCWSQTRQAYPSLMASDFLFSLLGMFSTYLYCTILIPSITLFYSAFISAHLHLKLHICFAVYCPFLSRIEVRGQTLYPSH